MDCLCHSSSSGQANLKNQPEDRKSNFESTKTQSIRYHLNTRKARMPPTAFPQTCSEPAAVISALSRVQRRPARPEEWRTTAWKMVQEWFEVTENQFQAWRLSAATVTQCASGQSLSQESQAQRQQAGATFGASCACQSHLAPPSVRGFEFLDSFVQLCRCSLFSPWPCLMTSTPTLQNNILYSTFFIL